MQALDAYQVKEKIKELKNKRDQALLSFLYLTGCRVEEVVKYIQESKPNRTITIHKEGKKKKISQPILREFKGLPIKRSQIDIRDNEIIVNGVRCLKRREGTNSIKRTVPIIRNDKEEWFINVFLDYAQPLTDDEILFPLTRVRVYQILDRIGLFPHLLRHTRATILARDYHFTDIQLQRFFGWKDTRQTATYTHLNVEDIIDKMKKYG